MAYDSKADTLEHIKLVSKLLSYCATELLSRGMTHDESKLKSPEKEGFDKYTPMLKELTYGSEEYRQAAKNLGVSIKHHYENNSHHPEHYADGINGMSLFDLVEMVVDWFAATKRHNDGDIFKSLEINKERFNIDSQLHAILLNTITIIVDHYNECEGDE